MIKIIKKIRQKIKKKREIFDFQTKLLIDLKDIVDNEYFVKYIETTIEKTTNDGRQADFDIILAYCVQKDLSYFLEQFLRTFDFIEKRRYNEFQKNIMKVYLYYWKINKINININFKSVVEKCFKNIRKLNIDKEKLKYKKYNKGHYKKIKKLKRKKKKILKNKKGIISKLVKIFNLPRKTIDEVNIEVIDEYSSILLETIEFILMKILLGKEVCKFELRELNTSTKVVCDKRVMHNKYFIEEYIEKSITGMENGCMVLYIIEAILGAIWIIYNVIRFVLMAL